jgi:hypothetical protein
MIDRLHESRYSGSSPSADDESPDST